MEKIKEIFSFLSILIVTIMCIVLLILGVYNNNIKQIIGSSVGTLMILAFLFIYLYVLLGDSIFNKKEKIMKNKAINKENKTSFDYFVVDVIKEKADSSLVECLDTKNKTKPYDLFFDYYKGNVFLYYCYQGFDVEMKILETKILVSIDSPEKYDLLEENKMLEERKVVDCNLLQMTLEDIYVFISDLIKDYNNLIKEFTKSNKPNNHINGKTLSKIEAHIYESKYYAIIFMFFGLVISFVGCMFLYNCITNNQDFMAGAPVMCWIFAIIFLMLGVLSLKSSIKTFYKMKMFKKDKNSLVVEDVSGVCVKVKYFIDGAHRSYDCVVKTITLYLKHNNKVKKAIIVVNRRFKPFIFKSNNFRKMLLNKSYDFKCLKNSKFVLTGASNILNKLND